MEVDPEQNERPKGDREQGRQDLPQSIQALEVVVRSGNCDADNDVDEADEARSEQLEELITTREDP